MRTFTLVSILAVAAWTAPATAQTTTSIPPAAPLAVPALAPDLAGPARDWRRRLGGTPDDLLFTGEADTRILPVFLTPGEASRPTRLEIATVSAISASPDVSRITVSINGALLGERPVRGFDAPETLGFDIAPGLLQPGYNAVRVDVRQTHRVDCSLEATYELWTRIVPEGTGFVFDGAPSRILDLGALAAVPAGADGRTEIRLRTGDARDPASLDRLARAAQALAVAGRYAEPVVSLGSGRVETPGVDLVVATRDRLRGLGLGAPAAPGPSVALVDDARTGRLTLVVTGANADELDDALTLFERRALNLAPVGSPAGLAALDASPRRLEGGETLRLTEIGLDPRPFAGRFFRAEADVILPADFYAADYDRMTLALDAAYAPGLASGSALVVRVNGAAVASVAMANPRGDVLRDREVHLPLKAFKPGHNVIAFEASTAARADEACLPETIGRGQDRFVLSPTSTLRVPRLARIGSLPDIAGLSAGSLGLLAGREGLTVSVPGGDRDAIAAAMTVLVQSAATSRRTTPVRIGFQTPAPGAGHMLVVGPIDRIGDQVLAAADLPAARMRSVWAAEAAPATSRRVPQGPALPVRVASAGEAVLLDLGAPAQPSIAPDPAPADPAQASLLDAGRLDLGLGDDPRLGWLVAPVEAGVERLLRVAAVDLPQLGLARAAPPPLPVDASATLVVAQGAARQGGYADAVRAAGFDLAALNGIGDPSGTGLLPRASSVTVITAADGATLREGVAAFFGSGAAQELVGQAAMFQGEEARVASRVAPADVLVETQAFSAGNARLVLAGWLSRNTAVYLGVLAALGLALSIAAYAAVRLSGVRN
ncbi:cellulose biosynthesis cyclic di-GMP-binding regulatory protein BcsB [Salinarimonas sp.]|uniref:cellulose biosynthesis cyclic di-GMP-binding regulatory protein BcsB n=1 Tax=Salinarimonas sp. TaxID=2766526 RepID=UPI0032D8BFAA